MPWKPAFPGERPTLGWYVLDWFADYLIVPDGASSGEPLVLTREQAEFILRLYEVDRHFTGEALTGRSLRNGRLIRRALLSRAKGWGKSPLVGALCLVEALGDVVMDGWDADGRPVGKPWASLGFKPKVQIVAVSEDQTENTWEPTLDMVRRGPVLDAYDIEPMETFINVPSGVVEAVTSSGTSREGFRPVFSAMDQTESWMPTNGGVRLAATIRRNLSKTDGCSVETPNAFEPGTGSVAESSFAAMDAQESGRTRISTGILLDHREAPADTDPADEASLRKGLAYAYGESADVNGGWVSLDRKVAEYWDPDTDPQDARRYYLNQVTHASDSWVTSPEVRACIDLDKMVGPGDTVVLGFDGSRGRNRGNADATALIGCRVSDGHLFEVRVWEQPTGPAGEDWAPDVTEVEAAVRQCFDDYRVVGFYADPTGWTSQVADWEADYGRRLRVKATQRQPVTAWPRGKNTYAIEYVQRLHDAIVNGECSLDGSSALVRHLLNARRRKASREGYLIYKQHPDSADKIDAAYAAVMAWKARTDAVSAGVRTTSGGRSSGSREAVVL